MAGELAAGTDVGYPPVGFFFQLSLGEGDDMGTSFQEVSGIGAEMNTEELTEGGENRFIHRVPAGTKYSNLIVKRGLVHSDATLAQWCLNTIESDFSAAISTKSIILTLVDADSRALMAWTFFNAWPVKWSISDLKTLGEELAIESVEFVYSYFIVNQ